MQSLVSMLMLLLLMMKMILVFGRFSYLWQTLMEVSQSLRSLPFITDRDRAGFT